MTTIWTNSKSYSVEGNMDKEAYTWFKSLSKNEQIELLDGQQYGSKGSFNNIDNSQIGVGGELDLLIENIYYSKFLGKDPQAISYGDKNEYPIDDDKDPDQEDRAKIRTAFRGSRYGNTGYSHQNESYDDRTSDPVECPECGEELFPTNATGTPSYDKNADSHMGGFTCGSCGSYTALQAVAMFNNMDSSDLYEKANESGQVDKDPNWKSGRFRRGGSWADKKDAWDKTQGEALPPTDANEEEWLNNYSDNVDQSKKTNEDFDSYNLGNPKDDLPKHRTVDDRIEDTQEAKEVGCDQCDGSGFIHDEGGRTKEERSACKNCDGKGFVERGGLFKEVKGDYVVYDGEDYSVEDTTRNEEESTSDRAGQLMRDQKATSNFWEDTQKSKVPQGQGHKWQKHGEQDDRPEDSHVTVDLSDKKSHDDLDDEFWKGVRGESKTYEIFEDLEEVTELDDSEKDEVFEFLFDLRESGKTNMFGAGRYVQEEFGFEKKLTDNIVQEWMKNFKELSRRMGRD